MERNLWKKIRYNIFLSRRHKVLYISAPKAACTSLKWWFADLEGRTEAIKRFSRSRESSMDLIVHDAFYQVAPDLTGLPFHVINEALSSPDYFRFAAVRNPYKRIFSAWQSKILLREPLQIDPYVSCEFFHKEIKSLDDIALAFEGFLEYIAENEAPYFLDPHWISQAELLRPDLINYTAVSKVEHMRELSAKLAQHIGSDSLDLFAPYRSNESLIPYLPRFITQRASELIISMYADDFRVFDFPHAPPGAKQEFTDAELDIALKAVDLIRGRHQRLEETRALNLRWRLRKRLRLLKREYLRTVRARLVKQDETQQGAGEVKIL